MALSSRFKSLFILKSFPKLSNSRGRGNCRSWGKKVKKYIFLFLVVVNVHTGKANVFEKVEDGLSDYFDYTLACWKEALDEFLVDVIDPIASEDGYYPSEYDRTAGCNALPLQRTPLPDGKNSKFNYFGEFLFC